MPVVVKPFNTTQRRFRVGAEVAETDDLTPHSFADLAARGFIGGSPGGAPAEQALHGRRRGRVA